MGLEAVFLSQERLRTGQNVLKSGLLMTDKLTCKIYKSFITMCLFCCLGEKSGKNARLFISPCGGG